MKISGHIIDIINRNIFSGVVTVKGNRIESIEKTSQVENQYILPGFIDSHIHIESSMLVPSEFARVACTHGTVGTVSDPHEIANVMGIAGVEFMIENAKEVPFIFYFGAPSCVPATPFETAGGIIDLKDLEILLKRDDILYLSEMMNVPGVLNQDSSELDKIKIAQKYNKKVDGHAPSLTGDNARVYIESGISTDHECVSLEEAIEKIKYGMIIQIREGSATRDLDALMPLINQHPENIMFCSDDRHPDNLVEGHINTMVKRAIDEGYDIFNTLQAACVNPVKHYGLNIGLLKTGDSADFIVIDDLDNMNILSTYISGTKVAENGNTLIPQKQVNRINCFNTKQKSPDDFILKYQGNKIKAISITDGQIITRETLHESKVQEGNVIPDIENDLLKITVVNRYKDSKPAVAFVHNFGLKSGAIASSVAHDSHNIIAVGVSDEEITNAVNLIIENKGGVSLSSGDNQKVLPLPVAGIMTDANGYEVAKKYSELDRMSKELGSNLQSPFMTLSFMALLVIPDIKISDKGLFDGNQFKLIDNFTNG